MTAIAGLLHKKVEFEILRGEEWKIYVSFHFYLEHPPFTYFRLGQFHLTSWGWGQNGKSILEHPLQLTFILDLHWVCPPHDGIALRQQIVTVKLCICKLSCNKYKKFRGLDLSSQVYLLYTQYSLLCLYITMSVTSMAVFTRNVSRLWGKKILGTIGSCLGEAVLLFSVIFYLAWVYTTQLIWEVLMYSKPTDKDTSKL